MATISLNNSAFTTIDDEDLPIASQYRWRLSTGGYAFCLDRQGKRCRSIYLHRVLLNPPPEMEVDHINGDKLDNRRRNLRPATRSQNEQNKRHPSKAKSGYRGAHWYGKKNRYRARVMLGGRFYSFGYFRDPKLAAIAAANGRRKLMTHAPECEVQS